MKMAEKVLFLVDKFSMEVARKVKELKVTTDQELLSELRKTREISMAELNNMLLRLEILGLVTVTWMDKDRRRIEYREPVEEEKVEEETS
jgi:DNA-binding HxlR family transcriptional regulator